MDLIKLKNLPKIKRKREGKLQTVPRSENYLTAYEFQTARIQFRQFDAENRDIIHKSELRPLLLALNLKIDDEIFLEYANAHFNWSDKNNEDITFNDFLRFLQDIFANQTKQFRVLYSDGAPSEMAKLCEYAMNDARAIFEAYDDNKNGFIEAHELRNLFFDMGYKQVNDANFDAFFQNQYDTADLNHDGLLSFGEFVNIHNKFVDML